MSKYTAVDFRWIFYSLLGISFFAPLGLNTFFLILALLVGFLKFEPGIFFRNLKEHSFLLMSSVFFLWHLISMYWTENTAEGWAEITSKLPFIIVPLALAGTQPLSRQMSRYALYGLIAGAVLGLLCCVILSFVEVLNNSEQYAGVIDAFTYEHLSWRIGIQPIYLSLFTICAFFFLFFEHVWLKTKFHLLALWLLAFFWLFIIMLSSRMEIMVFMFVFTLVMLLWGYKTKQYLIPALVIVFGCGISFALIILNPTNKERFTEMVDTKTHYEQNKWGGRGIRIQKWMNTFEAVRESPVLGVGAGDYWDELEKVYERNNFQLALQYSFNSHNQYLQTLLTTGAVGLLLLLSLLFLALRDALKNQNLQAAAFITVFSLSCITESMMERQWGIVLFCFYVTFLTVVYTPLKEKG